MQNLQPPLLANNLPPLPARPPAVPVLPPIAPPAPLPIPVAWAASGLTLQGVTSPAAKDAGQTAAGLATTLAKLCQTMLAQLRAAWTWLVRAFAKPGTPPLPPPPPTGPPFGTPEGLPGLAFGPRPGYIPTGDVTLAVGSLSQATLDALPVGARIVLAPGVHRLLAPLTLKAGQQLLGCSGAVISGAKELTGWRQEGNAWVVDGQTQRMPRSSVVPPALMLSPGHPLANQGETLFLDGQLLKPVATRAEVGPGTYFFDAINSRIVMGDDPQGHLIETPQCAQAITGGPDVVLQNLVVEKCGNTAQQAAINSPGGGNWRVENCEIRDNHGVGVALYGGVLRGCQIHNNGQLGVGGGGHGLLVEGNEIARNNTAGYNRGWEAGGTKWAWSTDLVVRGNWSHHNDGGGLATDCFTRNSTLESNLVEDNVYMGILEEQGLGATIRNNVARRNGLAKSSWDGAGIILTDSVDVEVTGNQVTGNGGGILLVHDRRLDPALARDHVQGNRIEMAQGFSGLVSDIASDYTSAGNSFSNNTFVVPNAADRHWHWGANPALLDEAGWQATGQS
jgi:hypothetical protein